MINKEYLKEISYSNNLIKCIEHYENKKHDNFKSERKYHTSNYCNFSDSKILPTLLHDENFGKYLMNELFKVSEYEDTYLNLLIKEQGFTGLPQMVDLNKFNELSKTKQVYCRGTRFPNAQMLFKHNQDMFIGKGHYSNGVYFAKCESVDKLSEYNRTGFIKNSEIKYDNNFLISGVLDDNAKVIESDMLDLMLERDCKNLKEQDVPNLDVNSLKKLITYNRGVYAVLKGYDAIIPNTVASNDELILLNRTCMITPKVLARDFEFEMSIKK